jgi:hypothetical protein
MSMNLLPLARTRIAAVRRQRGSALAVAIVLLVLVSVMALFAIRVGTFEQRTSGNDLRAKMVQQVADSALTQGAERVLSNRDMLGLNTGNWQLCAADDTTFPCGSVPVARRPTMYRFVGGTTDVLSPSGVDAFDQRMVPLDRRVARVNDSSATATDGFPVQYGVGAVMCRLVPATLGTPASCSTNAADVINVHAVTLVAVAEIPGEGARATATKTFATNSTFPLGANTPPILASGSAVLRGGMQVVTSPNAAGPGVPVSIWSRNGIDGNGTPDTCYADEFFRSGNPTMYPPSAPTEDQIMRCDDCDCGLGQLTRGQGNSCTGGMDVVTIGAECTPNRPLRPEEFPCDLFLQVFGVRAWRDATSPPDYFCETRVTVTDPTDSSQQIGADEAYLAEKADWIVTNTTGFGARFAGDSRVIPCSQDAFNGKSGLIWVRTGSCGDGMTIGSPAGPVLLVHDALPGNPGGPSFQNLVLFGLLFGRSIGPGPLDPATGGNVAFKINAGSAIYGAAVVQGSVTRANGTAVIVYDSKVLGNLVNDLSDPDLLGIPGSWTDAKRY